MPQPQTETGCCPRFDPAPWEDTEVDFEGRRFVKDRVRAVFHIPINFGSVMKRNMERIERAGAKSGSGLILAEDNSLWGTDVYLEVTRDVPGAEMTSVPGKFLTRVFEGPYRNVSKWIAEMTEFVRSRGEHVKKMYTYYTTCPNCAKAYGKNYVVMVAEV